MTSGFNSSQPANPVATEAERLPEPLLHATGGVTYVGDAPLGTGEDEPRWRIKRRSTVNGVSRTDYADGGAFTQKWSERLGLTYAR